MTQLMNDTHKNATQNYDTLKNDTLKNDTQTDDTYKNKNSEGWKKEEFSDKNDTQTDDAYKNFTHKKWQKEEWQTNECVMRGMTEEKMEELEWRHNQSIKSATMLKNWTKQLCEFSEVIILLVVRPNVVRLNVWAPLRRLNYYFYAVSFLFVFVLRMSTGRSKDLFNPHRKNLKPSKFF